MEHTRPAASVGTRIVVTGMAGAGKSTFSRGLSVQTGLDVIQLDLHGWAPGWVRIPRAQLVGKHRTLLSAAQWIVDSNDVDEDLLLQRADTLVVLATPWWLCCCRAFRRGVRRPRGCRLPPGCEDSLRQRIGDEWGIVWRNWRNRRTVQESHLALATRCQGALRVHVLTTKQEQADFLRSLSGVA